MKRTIESVRTVIGRRRRTTTLVLATSSLALASLWASVMPAAASPVVPDAGIGTFIFASGAAHVSGAGHGWGLTVGLESLSLGSAPAFNVVALGISTPHLGGTEDHSWGGQLASGDMAISSAAVMTINSRASLSPVASLTLTFRPTSRTTDTRDCVTGKEIVYTGTLKGSVLLRTGLKGLTLSSAHLSFGRHNTLTTTSDCVFSPCHFTFWDSTSSPSKTAAFAAGTHVVVPGHSASAAAIQRSVPLPGKNKLTRFDLWSIPAKAPVFTRSSKTLSVTSSSSGLITGAATLVHAKSNGSAPGTSKICYLNGKRYAQTDTEYLHAHYAPSRPFEAHTILNGIVTVQPSDPARFDIVTLKRK
jgi:hypothetical protein